MGVIGYLTTPAPLLIVSFHLGGGILRSNERIALVPELPPRL
jgi:hypothetical protein